MNRTVLLMTFFSSILFYSCKKSTTNPQSTTTQATSAVTAKLTAGNGEWHIDTGAFYYYNKSNQLVDSTIITFDNGYWTFYATSPDDGPHIEYFEAPNLPATITDIPYTLSNANGINYITTGETGQGSSAVKYQIQTLTATKLRLMSTDFASLPTGIDHGVNIQALSKVN